MSKELRRSLLGMVAADPDEILWRRSTPEFGHYLWPSEVTVTKRHSLLTAADLHQQDECFNAGATIITHTSALIDTTSLLLESHGGRIV